MTNEELLKVIEEAKARKAIYLDLRSKDLKELPTEICQLNSLKELYLNYNQLKRLPHEIIQLKRLKVLGLGGNKFNEVPSEVFELTNLTDLYLWRNQIKELSPEIYKLLNLKALDLSENQISYLPIEVIKLPNIENIELDNNPLISPPLETAQKGVEAIRRYFAEMHGKKQPLNEVKLLLVGEGAAGKTSLVKQVLDQKFDPHEDTTQGINIRGWNPKSGDKDIKVHIWDFGGQEIMHATHQFFLSKRSLYVLVLDGRKDEQTEYWLRHINTFGGASPVLIVLNKQDAHPGFELNDTDLIRKFPNIKGCYRTSCKTGQGIALFRDVLRKELSQIEMVSICWPSSWFQVKEQIEHLNKPYINYEEYESICIDSGVNNDDSCEKLIDDLHDLGVAIHFKDFVLDNTHVLDPVWVTMAVYKIINAKEVANNKGLLHLKNLRRILRQQKGEKHAYPHDKYIYFLELMIKFELCWSVSKDAVLIPQLLPVKEPDFSFDESACLRFILHYPHFLPPSVFPRFLVKVHKDIKADLRWRTGAVLVNEEFGAEALIRADIETRQISIFVHGSQRKDYFAVLLLFFREINATFEQLNVNELVPMPDAPEVTARYSTLLKLAEKGMDKYLPDGSDTVYSVKELLGLVQFNAQADVLEKILSILMRMEDRQFEDEKSFIERAHNMLELKPSLFGIGINANAVLDELFKLLKQQRTKRKKQEQITS